MLHGQFPLTFENMFILFQFKVVCMIMMWLWWRLYQQKSRNDIVFPEMSHMNVNYLFSCYPHYNDGSFFDNPADDISFAPVEVSEALFPWVYI